MSCGHSVRKRFDGAIAAALSVILVLLAFPAFTQETSSSATRLYERLMGLELIQLAGKGDDEGIRKFLNEQPGDLIDYVYQNSYTALIAASYQGHETTVALLLSRGANVNKPGASGQTALMTAALYDHPGVAKTLLDSGATVDLTDLDGATALLWAADSNSTEVVRLLLDHGANLKERDRFRQTALIKAARGGSLEVVRRLLPAIRNDGSISFEDYLNARNQWDYTALMHAYDNWNYPVVEDLLEAGANFDGYEFRIAAMQNDVERMDTLLASGANIDAFGESFSIGGQPTSALVAAAMMGHEEAVDFLLSNGAEPAGTKTLLQLILSKTDFPARPAFGIDHDTAQATGEPVVKLWSREEARILADPGRVERIGRIISRLKPVYNEPASSTGELNRKLEEEKEREAARREAEEAELRAMEAARRAAAEADRQAVERAHRESQAAE